MFLCRPVRSGNPDDPGPTSWPTGQIFVFAASFPQPLATYAPFSFPTWETQQICQELALSD